MNHPRIDVERPKRLHVKLSEDEHVKIKMVADHIGVGISDFIRPMVMRIVEREIDARGLRAALGTWRTIRRVGPGARRRSGPSR